MRGGRLEAPALFSWSGLRPLVAERAWTRWWLSVSEGTRPERPTQAALSNDSRRVVVELRDVHKAYNVLNCH